MSVITKRILALVVMLAILALAACSNSATPSSSNEPYTQSKSATLPSSSASSSENQAPLAVSSYDEYFSQSVDYIDTLNNADEGVVFIYGEGADYTTEWDDKEMREAFPDAVPSQLYKWKVNTSDPNNYITEYSLLLDENVTEYDWVGDDRIFCAVGNTVYSINYSGEDKQTVLTADGPVTNLIANETLVFYVVDEYIYRHYIPDNITDKLCHAPGILPGYPVPLTNNQVFWCVYAPDRPEDDFRMWYVYTGPGGEAEEISFDEYEKLHSEWRERTGENEN